ncbi:hypothetical protein JCM10212_004939 [Sporobolomyces blumeae]
MATIESLRSRKDAIVEQFHDNADVVREIQQDAIAELVPALRDELDLDEASVASATKLLQDRVTVFRFCRRARFSPHVAFKLLHATLSWRLSPSFQHLSPASVPSLYLTNPLFFFHPRLIDRFGRPCAVLNLRHVHRTEDGKLDALKDFARLGWETGRRWLSDLSRARVNAADPTLQMVVIVDLDQAGMSNLEVELLPFFMDLLKNHFPGMIGAIFVLNYGWAYAGMWQLAKRVLPNTALERILFPSKAELLEFFDEDHLLVEHGGKVEYEYTPANPILEKYGYSPSTCSESGPSSVAPSTNVSSTSLRTEVFHSAEPSRPATPSLSRRPSGLTMTSGTSAASSKFVSSWFGGWGRSAKGKGSEQDAGLRRVRSFAELQAKLEETQRELDSEDSIDSDDDDEGPDGESELGAETVESGTLSRTQSRRSSRFSSRATSRTVSRDVSRETSPTRRRVLEPLSTLDLDLSTHAVQTMSPYNASNPHFGYPAIVAPSALDPSGIPRPHHHRRRKRDLVRTLTYLAALRFLALHRYLRFRISLLFAIVLRIPGLGWMPLGARRLKNGGGGATASGAKDKDGDSHRAMRVHWVESPSLSGASHAGLGRPSSTTSHARTPPRLVEVDPVYVYILLVFVVARTPHRRDKLKRLLRLLCVDVPVSAAHGARAAALRMLVGRERATRLLVEMNRG